VANTTFRGEELSMIKLTVLYGPPADPEAFEEYYADVHMPLDG
jgi:hypothetical protein